MGPGTIKRQIKIGDKFKVTTSTYHAIAPVVELGSGIPLPAEGTSLEEVQAQAAELKAGGSGKQSAAVWKPNAQPGSA